MALVLENEIVKPAIVLNKLWVRHLSISGPQAGQEISVSAVLVPCNDAGDQDISLAESLDLNNFMQLAAADPEGLEAQCLDAVLKVLEKHRNLKLQSQAQPQE